MSWLRWFFNGYDFFLFYLSLYGLWCGYDALRIIRAAYLELKECKDKLCNRDG